MVNKEEKKQLINRAFNAVEKVLGVRRKDIIKTDDKKRRLPIKIYMANVMFVMLCKNHIGLEVKEIATIYNRVPSAPYQAVKAHQDFLFNNRDHYRYKYLIAVSLMEETNKFSKAVDLFDYFSWKDRIAILQIKLKEAIEVIKTIKHRYER